MCDLSDKTSSLVNWSLQLTCHLRAFKQRRRRRRGRCFVKNEFIFYKQNSWSVRYTNGSKNVLKLNMNNGLQFQMEIRKFSCGRPRSVDGAELGHFTLLFCKGRQRNVQKIYNARAQLLFWTLNLFFSDVFVSGVIMVCLSSSLSRFLRLHCSSVKLFSIYLPYRTT